MAKTLSFKCPYNSYSGLQKSWWHLAYFNVIWWSFTWFKTSYIFSSIGLSTTRWNVENYVWWIPTSQLKSFFFVYYVLFLKMIVYLLCCSLFWIIQYYFKTYISLDFYCYLFFIRFLLVNIYYNIYSCELLWLIF